MIEVAIPQDICEYESKLIGPFTTRQTICGIVAGGLIFTLYSAFGKNMSLDTFGYIAIAIAAPAIAFSFKVYDLPFEKFLKVLYRFFFYQPKIRTYQVENTFEMQIEEMKKMELLEAKQKKEANKKGKKKKEKKKKKE